MVAVLTVIGALAGALADPAPEHRFESQAVVKVAPEHPGTKLLALVVADPDLIVTALADADVDVDPDDVAEQISVVAEPKDGIVTITAAADSNSDADRLVKSLIAQGAAVTRMGINQAEDGIDYSFGDFEHGIGYGTTSPRASTAGHGTCQSCPPGSRTPERSASIATLNPPADPP